jgi:hypothetical protein
MDGIRVASLPSEMRGFFPFGFAQGQNDKQRQKQELAGKVLLSHPSRWDCNGWGTPGFCGWLSIDKHDGVVGLRLLVAEGFHGLYS